MENLDTNPFFPESNDTSANKGKEKRNTGKEMLHFGKTLKSALLGTAILLSGDETVKHEKTWEEMRDRAHHEMVENGTTREQRMGYFQGMSELVYKEITPANYALDWKSMLDLIGKNIQEGRMYLAPSREDAWRLYLGLSQEHKTFSISDFKPQKSSENIYYFSISSYFNDYEKSDIQRIVGDIEFREQNPHAKRRIPTIDVQANVMGAFSWSKGVDENGHYIAYYDKWDLSNPIEKISIIGKPFEIYDRLYYDPVTFEPKKR